jgi:hypothetical protein
LKGKRTLGRSRREWKNNINIHSKGIGRVDVGGINLAEDRVAWWTVANMVIKLPA